MFKKTYSKYHNEKVKYNGMEFDSKAEFNRYMELKMLQRAGRIGSIDRQVRFELVPYQRGKNGKVLERPVYYYADFVYQDYEKDKLIVEDVKGGEATRTPEYIIKRKLMLFRHGIKITEVN